MLYIIIHYFIQYGLQLGFLDLFFWSYIFLVFVKAPGPLSGLTVLRLLCVLWFGVADPGSELIVNWMQLANASSRHRSQIILVVSWPFAQWHHIKIVMIVPLVLHIIFIGKLFFNQLHISFGLAENKYFVRYDLEQ